MRWILIALSVALTPMLHGMHVPVAHAQMAPVGNKPLVVVRFNQRKVYYERQLYTALQQAVATKPSVLFEVVSYVPIGRDAHADADLAARAQANMHRVLGSFSQMGVPQERVQITTERDAQVKHHEIHVFVY